MWFFSNQKGKWYAMPVNTEIAHIYPFVHIHPFHCTIGLSFSQNWNSLFCLFSVMNMVHKQTMLSNFKWEVWLGIKKNLNRKQYIIYIIYLHSIITLNVHSKKMTGYFVNYSFHIRLSPGILLCCKEATHTHTQKKKKNQITSEKCGRNLIRLWRNINFLQ